MKTCTPDQPDTLRSVLSELRDLVEPMTRMDSRRDAILALLDEARALATSAAAGEGGEG